MLLRIAFARDVAYVIIWVSIVYISLLYENELYFLDIKFDYNMRMDTMSKTADPEAGLEIKNRIHALLTCQKR